MNDSDPLAPEATLWERTAQALSSVYDTLDPEIALGQVYFPRVVGAMATEGEAGSCLDHTRGVPIAPLDQEQVTALVGDLEAQGAPTDFAGALHEAWRQGRDRIEQWRASPPSGYEEASGVIVLLTDGMPTYTVSCPGSDATTSPFEQLVTDTAVAASLGIRTVVIGLPGSRSDHPPSDDLTALAEEGLVEVVLDPSTTPSRSKLSELAVAGDVAPKSCEPSTDPCHTEIVNEPDLVSRLQLAVSGALTGVRRCEFVIPSPNENVFVSVYDMTVRYYQGGQPPFIDLTRSADGCTTGEWLLTKDEVSVHLCESACAIVKQDELASMEVYFGCMAP